MRLETRRLTGALRQVLPNTESLCWETKHAIRCPSCVRQPQPVKLLQTRLRYCMRQAIVGCNHGTKPLGIRCTDSRLSMSRACGPSGHETILSNSPQLKWHFNREAVQSCAGNKTTRHEFQTLVVCAHACPHVQSSACLRMAPLFRLHLSVDTKRVHAPCFGTCMYARLCVHACANAGPIRLLYGTCCADSTLQVKAALKMQARGLLELTKPMTMLLQTWWLIPPIHCVDRT